ncbi:MAG: hypothetical protein ACLT8E_12685 [Akkermansia sp.]
MFKTPLAVIEGGCEAGRARQSAGREGMGKSCCTPPAPPGEELLDVSRLESGALKPKLDWCDLGMLKGLWLLPGKHAGIIPCLFPCRRTIRW